MTRINNRANKPASKIPARSVHRGAKAKIATTRKRTRRGYLFVNTFAQKAVRSPEQTLCALFETREDFFSSKPALVRLWAGPSWSDRNAAIEKILARAGRLDFKSCLIHEFYPNGKSTKVIVKTPEVRQ